MAGQKGNPQESKDWSKRESTRKQRSVPEKRNKETDRHGSIKELRKGIE
jgi:hypothetical protein